MTDEGEYTLEEVRTILLEHFHSLVIYWSEQDKPVRERMEGLVFSILATLDGDDPNLPAMLIFTDPHPDDKQDCIENEGNWFPENPDLPSERALGVLHEFWYPVVKGDA